MSDTKAAWIAADWGASTLRTWMLDARDEVIASRESDRGIEALGRDDFEPALLELVGDHLPVSGRVQVLACGMVGAKQGWAEAPYAAVPCTPPGPARAARPEVVDPRLDIRILPGVSQSNPPDVMCGEETRIAGFLRDEPDFDGVLCLPGAHTRWVHVSAREIVSFRTFMTGEVFALLSGQSVLRHSVRGDDWDGAAFAEAITDAMTAPQKFAARLFSLRAGTLLNDVAAATSRARLSGLLLGLEIAGARDYWLGREIVLIGDPGLTPLYRKALAAQAAAVREADGAETVLAGLRAARAEIAP